MSGLAALPGSARLVSERQARRVVLAIAIASTLAARLVGWRVLRDVPHVMDEIAYVFQAKVLASGRLTVPVELPRAAFNMWFVDDRAARFGIFPPGWPLVLAVGLRLGLASWVGPLLHLATVVVLGRAGERLGGPRLGLVAAILYGLCPQAIVLSASLMSHALVAFTASVVTFALASLASGRASTFVFVASGAALGVAAMTRPLCAVVLAIPLAVMLVRARSARGALVTAAVASPFVLALAAYNRSLVGSALRFPQDAYFGEHAPPANVPFFTYGEGCNALGFGRACDHTVRGASHGLASALSDAGDNLRAWAVLVGPVILVAALASLVRARRVAWLLAMPALSILLYMLYWQAGVCYGARFYHAALPALVLAAAVGVSGSRPAPVRGRVLAVLVAGAMSTYAVGFGVALREMRAWSWWGTDDRFVEVARSWGGDRAVVMVAFGRDDVKNPELFATAAMDEGGVWLLGIRALAALGANEPEPGDGRVVFAKFHPALVEELAERFPERRLWLYTAWADRSKDVLEPWRPERFADHAYRRPADNFDGFRIGPPLELPDPLMREPTDEGWPPPPAHEPAEPGEEASPAHEPTGEEAPR